MRCATCSGWKSWSRWAMATTTLTSDLTGPPLSVLTAATRGSQLARWQTDHIAELLRAVAPDLTVEQVLIQTTGDRRLDIPIWEMGGKGVFVKEVQAAVLDGRARLAVHSGKDLPSTPHPDLVIAAVPRRGDPRDALVGSTLADLAPGATVATGSVRRRAQLAWLRPDLTFTSLRGNVPTRLEKIPEGGAIVTAAAALERLDATGKLQADAVPVELLATGVMLPQVAQGALAVECRVDDHEARALLAAIDDPASHLVFDAERAFLAELGGDCDLPAGAYGILDPDSGLITLRAILAAADGHVLLEDRRTGRDPAGLGRAAARYLLDDAGGSSLLER
jgi:hydroxymethylbilane synthase